MNRPCRPNRAMNASGSSVLARLHRPPPVATDETWPVGELVMARQGMPGSAPRHVPIAFVSIEAARQILGSAGIGAEPARRTEQRLGIVVGRAVAHEIGHLLGFAHNASETMGDRGAQATGATTYEDRSMNLQGRFLDFMNVDPVNSGESWISRDNYMRLLRIFVGG